MLVSTLVAVGQEKRPIKAHPTVYVSGLDTVLPEGLEELAIGRDFNQNLSEVLVSTKFGPETRDSQRIFHGLSWEPEPRGFVQAFVFVAGPGKPSEFSQGLPPLHSVKGDAPSKQMPFRL